ncbi:hypothetical protein BJV74DRAFT_877434 [Russula compacta]|nr:hypothetical protein BJV74DRAFT_877434 [Russula compacta]
MSFRNSVVATSRNRGKPQPVQRCCRLYTFSTRDPIIRHSSLIASDDTYLTFLPRAHILEYLLNRPMIIVGVPAVWELVRKGILAQMNNSSEIRKSMFNGAMSYKNSNMPLLTSMVDSVVFAKIQQATGGHLRLAMSGGAALSR